MGETGRKGRKGDRPLGLLHLFTFCYDGGSGKRGCKNARGKGGGKGAEIRGPSHSKEKVGKNHQRV